MLKELNPVDIDEYVTAIGLQDKPAFAWWVPFTLKKRGRIVAGLDSRVRMKGCKFGIKIPTSVTEAREFDEKNGNSLWMDALNKEMSEVGVAFKILDEKEIYKLGTPNQADISPLMYKWTSQGR